MLKRKYIISVLTGILFATGCSSAPEDVKQQSPEPSQVETNQAPAATPSAPVAARQFDYKPTAPAENARLLGVGAIGASELTSLVVKIDTNKAWQLEKRLDDKSLMIEGAQDEAIIQENLKKYLSEMSKIGVPASNMHFVISSGAIKSGNADTLIKNLKSSGYIVNEITPEQEGKLAFKATVPAEYRTNSIMIDIGSGNTKISWEDNGNLKALETYGAKYFEKDVTPKQVFDDVTAAMEKVPADKKKHVFIIGGVPYTLAKPIRIDKQRYVVLNSPDSYQAEDEKQKAGLNIYSAMVANTGAETQYIFDFDSHYAIGFLQGLAK